MFSNASIDGVETKAGPGNPSSAKLGHFRRVFLEWYGQQGGSR